MHPIGPNDRQHLPSLPIQPLVPPPTYSVSLDQDELIQSLFSYKHPPVSTKLSSSSPLLCMSENKILDELHHSGLSPPPVRLILPMHPKQTLIGHQRSFIGLWDVVNLEIINTLFLPQRMEHSTTVESSPFHLEHTPPHKTNKLISQIKLILRYLYWISNAF